MIDKIRKVWLRLPVPLEPEEVVWRQREIENAKEQLGKWREELDDGEFSRRRGMAERRIAILKWEAERGIRYTDVECVEALDPTTNTWETTRTDTGERVTPIKELIMEKYGVKTDDGLTKKGEYGDRSCPQCGSELVSTNPPICPKCGSEALEGPNGDKKEGK